jgi:DNA modification methylase
MRLVRKARRAEGREHHREGARKEAGEKEMRLILGDCIETLKSMPDKSVDCIITDPPYGIGEAAGKNKTRGGCVGFGGKKGNYVPSKDYGSLVWDDIPPSPEYFSEMIRVSRNQIIFGGNYFALPPSSCWIVWDKMNGASDFADCELAWTSFKSAVRIFRYRWQGMLQGDMGHKEERFHPTQKPLPLMEWIVNKYTKEGETILDPFMGSGTTGMAVLKNGRDFIGVEKEPDYFIIAEARIDKWSNQTRLDGR